MRIALVSTFVQPIALGLRYVSAALKVAGQDVEVFFMCSRRPTANADFPEAALQTLAERCQSADLIGLSLMTISFRRAIALTEYLRRTGVKAPIVWGGTHPTVAPKESLGIADAICIGEGELPVCELAKRMQSGKDPTATGSFWFRAGGAFGNQSETRNPVMPLPENLDSYAFPDYELEKQWVLQRGELVPATFENTRAALHRIRVETTRGCPYHCSFCNNTVWQNLYRGKGRWVRMRSNENIMAEIESMVA